MTEKKQSHCSQCGQLWAMPACGPTHAMIAIENAAPLPAGPAAPQTPQASCLDCGQPYLDFPLDVTLPDEQWALIHPEGEGGLLCAACIVKRASLIPHAVAVRAVIDTGERAPLLTMTAEHFQDCMKIGGSQTDLVNRCSGLLQELDAQRSRASSPSPSALPPPDDKTPIVFAFKGRPVTLCWIDSFGRNLRTDELHYEPSPSAALRDGLREALCMIEEFDTNGLTALTPKGREDVERLKAILNLGSTESP